MNRNVNVALSNTGPAPTKHQLANPFTSADPDVLPGHTDTSAPDGPNNEVNTGYLWNAALRAHLTVRNYGFFVDGTLYGTASSAIPVLRDPFSTDTVVSYPASVELAPFTDPFFGGSTTRFRIIGVTKSGPGTSTPDTPMPITPGAA